MVYNGSTLGKFLRDSTLWFERNVVGDTTIGLVCGFRCIQSTFYLAMDLEYS